MSTAFVVYLTGIVLSPVPALLWWGGNDARFTDAKIFSGMTTLVWMLLVAGWILFYDMPRQERKRNTKSSE